MKKSILVLIVAAILMGSSCVSKESRIVTKQAVEKDTTTESVQTDETIIYESQKPIEGETYILSDILMMKLTKNYVLTCSYEFEDGDVVPYNEVFDYFTYDGCYSFDERTLAPEMIDYYDPETRMFTVPRETADELLVKRFNTEPDPESVGCYDSETDCYVFERHYGEYYYEPRIISKNMIRDNVYQFDVELYDPLLEDDDVPVYVFSFTVELNEDGYKYLGFKNTGEGSEY